MPWKQIVDPFNNIGLSVAVAIVPLLFIFWALIIKKMKGYLASVLACILALVIAVAVYSMPAWLALLSAANGALYGLFPICWIILPAVFLFNITVQSGQFEVIRAFMAGITSDRRIQAVLIAFSFGSFLEGTAGFGAPVAITAAMLVGLGFEPLFAAGLCLIANTAPVAFGSIGIPITVAAQVSGLPEMAISQMVGRTLPFLSIFIPFYLVAILAGFKKTVAIWPVLLVSGGSFALLQWFSSNYLGPYLPDVIAGIGSILWLVVFLQFWKPAIVWHFATDVAPAASTTKIPAAKVLKAFSPFILLTLSIIFWGLAPVKKVLDGWLFYSFNFPGLTGNLIGVSGQPIVHLYKFNVLTAAGTAILLAGVLSVPLIGLTYKQAIKTFASTLYQLRFPIITVASILGFAYVVNDSGMSLTMAQALAATGFLFPFFAPLLGWLGVFITGSDTSANALFGKLQASTATAIGVDPVVTVGANISGGVVGKMISPQSIAVAAAAGKLVGREADLFKFTVKHSFIMLFFISCLVLAQAYLFQWMIPKYQIVKTVAAVATSTGTTGYYYLALLVVLIAVLFVMIGRYNGKTREKMVVK